MSLPPTSMSDYDASSRYLAFRRCKVNVALDLAPGASRSGSTSGSAEPFLGIGFGDRFEVSQGDSGLLEGGVVGFRNSVTVHGTRSLCSKADESRAFDVDRADLVFARETHKGASKIGRAESA
jgi:hypothetical protein